MLLASERARADVAKKRDTWIARRLPIMRAMPHRLVFIDETSTSTKMTRLRGRTPIGKRLPGAVPFGHWLSQTFIAGLRCNGLTAPWLIEGAMDRPAIDLYIETQLAPTLQPGDVVILAKVRVSTQAADALKERGTWFLFLPAYSPDLYPHLRGALACSRRHLLTVRAARVLELLQPRRLCLRLKAGCSS